MFRSNNVIDGTCQDSKQHGRGRTEELIRAPQYLFPSSKSYNASWTQYYNRLSQSELQIPWVIILGLPSGILLPLNKLLFTVMLLCKDTKIQLYMQITEHLLPYILYWNETNDKLTEQWLLWLSWCLLVCFCHACLLSLDCKMWRSVTKCNIYNKQPKHRSLAMSLAWNVYVFQITSFKGKNVQGWCISTGSHHNTAQ